MALADPTNIETPPSSRTASTKATKTKEIITVLSTAVPVLGAVGTLFVWLCANLYVGNVEIQPANKYETIVVDVFDQKGQQSSFHTPRFQLMPGKYHLAITTDKNTAQHVDAQIELGKTETIKIENGESTPAPSGINEPVARKHWWQFWKKSS